MIVTIAIFFSGGCTTPSAADPAATTTVTYFTPFGPTGLSEDLTVSEKGDGSCWLSSSSVERPDAYRCGMNKTIFDPCFRNGEGTRVACPIAGPFRKTVIDMHLTQPLPKSTNIEPTRPWAIELANGGKCVIVNGATFVIAGMRGNYACNDGGWVIGDPSHDGSSYHALYARSIRSSEYGKVLIRKAIF